MLDKLFDHIELQLKEETDKYKKFKICKYVFEFSKVCVLSISVGISLSSILIPIIDAAKKIQMLIKDYIILN